MYHTGLFTNPWAASAPIGNGGGGGGGGGASTASGTFATQQFVTDAIAAGAPSGTLATKQFVTDAIALVTGYEGTIPQTVNVGSVQPIAGQTCLDPTNTALYGYLQPNTLYVVPNPAKFQSLWYGILACGGAHGNAKSFHFAVYNASATIPLRLSASAIFVRGSKQGWGWSLAVIQPLKMATFLYLTTEDTPYKWWDYAFATIVEYDTAATEATVLYPIILTP